LDSGECAKKALTAEVAEGLAEDAEKSFSPQRAQRKAAKDAKAVSGRGGRARDAGLSLDSGEYAKKALTAEVAEGLAEDAETAKGAKMTRGDWKADSSASAALGVGMTRFAKGDA
jgi:hypothetical protein